jgi:RNA polymerase sigma-70 factor (ECF subfamily)
MTDVESALEAERTQLRGLAYRMLGTLADAEDAVQEAFLRWYRLPDAERDAVRSPGAYLTRVTSRICLDMLGSARARREQYVGEWLPEPVHEASALLAPPPSDPLERVVLDDAVSTALLIVLDTLSPAERVAFVLHDVFGVTFAEIAEILGRSPAAARQLATSARRRLADRRQEMAPVRRHDELVQAFAAACATGDIGALTAVLDPDVVLRADGGGLVSAARRPVFGSDRVARFILGLAQQHASAEFEPARTPDGSGFVVRLQGRLHSVWTFGVGGQGGDRVTDVWVVSNPEKLSDWE